MYCNEPFNSVASPRVGSALPTAKTELRAYTSAKIASCTSADIALADMSVCPYLRLPVRSSFSLLHYGIVSERSQSHD